MRIEDKLVKHLMTRHPALLSPDDDLSRAVDVMRVGRIRHLLIVDESDRLVGVLSAKDVTSGALFRASGIERPTEQRILCGIAIRDVMSKRVHTITADVPLSEAALLMNRYKISCLPVVSEDEILGILTESDFVLAFIDPPLLEEVEGEFENEADTENDWAEFENECARLRAIRDELRVQLQLANLEARDCFERAERLWSRLERRLPEIQAAPAAPVSDAARVGRNFLKETHALYAELREHLGSTTPQAG